MHKRVVYDTSKEVVIICKDDTCMLDIGVDISIVIVTSIGIGIGVSIGISIGILV